MLAKSILSVAIMASLMGVASAQQTTSVGPAQRPARVLNALPQNATPISDWYNQDVYDPQNDKIGSISGVLLGQDGKVQALMVDVGGFVGIGSKTVAVPFGAIEPIKQSDGKVRLTMNASKAALKKAPGFKPGNNKGSWVPLS